MTQHTAHHTTSKPYQLAEPTSHTQKQNSDIHHDPFRPLVNPPPSLHRRTPLRQSCHRQSSPPPPRPLLLRRIRSKHPPLHRRPRPPLPHRGRKGPSTLLSRPHRLRKLHLARRPRGAGVGAEQQVFRGISRRSVLRGE